MTSQHFNIVHNCMLWHCCKNRRSRHTRRTSVSDDTSTLESTFGTMQAWAALWNTWFYCLNPVPWDLASKLIRRPTLQELLRSCHGVLPKKENKVWTCCNAFQSRHETRWNLLSHVIPYNVARWTTTCQLVLEASFNLLYVWSARVSSHTYPPDERTTCSDQDKRIQRFMNQRPADVESMLGIETYLEHVPCM